MANMSNISYMGNGGTDYVFAFPSLASDTIKVAVDGDVNVSYTVPVYSSSTGGTVRLAVAATNTEQVKIWRESYPATKQVTFSSTNVLKPSSLNLNGLQLFYLAQEALEGAYASQDFTESEHNDLYTMLHNELEAMRVAVIALYEADDTTVRNEFAGADASLEAAFEAADALLYAYIDSIFKDGFVCGEGETPTVATWALNASWDNTTLIVNTANASMDGLQGETITAGRTIKFVGNGSIQFPTGAAAFTLACKIEAPNTQIFTNLLGNTGLDITFSGNATRLNVNWFGAVGDGSTDDSGAINTALIHVKEGNLLVFPNYEYRVDSELYVDRSYATVTLMSEGSTIISSDATTNNTIFRIAPTSAAVSTFVTLRNITFVSSAVAAIEDPLLWFKNCHQLTLDNCWIASANDVTGAIKALVFCDDDVDTSMFRLRVSEWGVGGDISATYALQCGLGDTSTAAFYDNTFEISGSTGKIAALYSVQGSFMRFSGELTGSTPFLVLGCNTGETPDVQSNYNSFIIASKNFNYPENVQYSADSDFNSVTCSDGVVSNSVYLRVYDRAIANPTSINKRVSSSTAVPTYSGGTVWDIAHTRTLAQTISLGFYPGDILFKAPVNGTYITDDTGQVWGWILVQTAGSNPPAFYWKRLPLMPVNA